MTLANAFFINTAWSISAMALLGDHMGFTAGVASHMIVPLKPELCLGLSGSVAGGDPDDSRLGGCL